MTTHIFDVQHAVDYGVTEAIMIANFTFWIAKNKANERHEYDGRTWTYNSVKAYKQLFPYFSESQVRRVLESLVAQGVLVTGNYNSDKRNQTKWYAFADENRFIFERMHLPNPATTFAENDKSTNTTDNKPDTGSQEFHSRFAAFWFSYPKKYGKPKAMTAFKKVKPEEFDALMAALEVQKKLPQWQENNGQFIPFPTTWINQRRWEDEVDGPEPTPERAKKFKGAI